MGGSQLRSSGERVPPTGLRQNQRRTLPGTNRSNRIDANEMAKVAHDKFGSFITELNRLRLWEVDVAEEKLEATLAEESPMYEPIKRILSQIANVVIAGKS